MQSLQYIVVTEYSDKCIFKLKSLVGVLDVLLITVFCSLFQMCVCFMSLCVPSVTGPCTLRSPDSPLTRPASPSDPRPPLKENTQNRSNQTILKMKVDPWWQTHSSYTSHIILVLTAAHIYSALTKLQSFINNITSINIFNNHLLSSPIRLLKGKPHANVSKLALMQVEF